MQMRWPVTSQPIVIILNTPCRIMSGLRIQLRTAFADRQAAAWAFAAFPEVLKLSPAGKLEPAAAFSVVHRLRRFKPVLPSAVCTDSVELALIISLIFFESCCRSESGEETDSACKKGFD